MNIVDQARLFATHQHNSINHVRKYTGTPYIEHPAAVVSLLKSIPHNDDMLAAAWLHDCVEDTPTTNVDIRKEFGSRIAHLVSDLTDISKPSDGNRRIRKLIDRAHLRAADPEAKTIKLADLIDNSKSIVQHDTSFAKVYLAEKAALLDVLKDGDSTLWHKAQNILDHHRHLFG